MSTETLVRLDDSGKTIYFSIFNSVGQVFDFHASVLAFANLGSALIPYIAATEYSNAGGSGKSQYIASVDLATINNTAALVNCTLIAFEQTGGSPAPATDSARSQPESLEIRFGSEDGDQAFRVHAGISTDTTSGSYLEVQAWLESNGAVVPLTSSATCTCNIRQIDAGADGIQISAVDFGNVNSQYIFVHSEADPSLETDRQYRALITITQDGKIWTTTKDFVVLP